MVHRAWENPHVQVPGSWGALERPLLFRRVTFWKGWETFINNYNTKLTKQSVNTC